MSGRASYESEAIKTTYAEGAAYFFLYIKYVLSKSCAVIYISALFKDCVAFVHVFGLSWSISRLCCDN